MLSAGGTEASNGYSLIESDYVLRRLKGGTNITITPSENQLLIDASGGTAVSVIGYHIVNSRYIYNTPQFKEYSPWFSDTVRMDSGTVTSDGTLGTIKNTHGDQCNRLYSHVAVASNNVLDCISDNATGNWTYQIENDTASGTSLPPVVCIKVNNGSANVITMSNHTDILKLNTWTFIAWKQEECYNPLLARGKIAQGSTQWYLPAGDNETTARGWMITRTDVTTDGIPEADQRYKIVLYGKDETPEQGCQWILPMLSGRNTVWQIQQRRTVLAIYMSSTGGKIKINNSPIIPFTFATDFTKRNVNSLDPPTTITDIGTSTPIPITIGGVWYHSGFSNSNKTFLYALQNFQGDLSDSDVNLVYENLKDRYHMQYAELGF